MSDTDSDSYDSKLDFTFEFSENDFSKLELTDSVFSPEYSVANVAWKLKLQRVVRDSGEHVLAAFLYARGETKLWCCYARICVTILSQNEDIENRFRKLEYLFSSVHCNVGSSSFMNWDDVTNPEFGYIMDDIVKFRVHIVADSPQNVDPNYEKVPVAPVKLEGWLSVFEHRINKQIVCRLAEEFKKITALSKREFEILKISKNNLHSILSDLRNILCIVKEDIITMREDIDTIKVDVGPIKEDINKLQENIDTVMGNFDTLEKDFNIVKGDISIVKEDVSIVKSTVDELKNLLLKRDENNINTDEEKANASNKGEENKDQEDETKNIFESEAENKDFVIKMLNDFKNEMKREFFSYQSRENQISCGTSPWCVNNEPCFPHPRDGYRCGYKSESYNHFRRKFSCPCETVSQDQFGLASYHKKWSDGNESDSTDTSRQLSVQPPPVSHPRIPSEGEAFFLKLDLNAPWRKDLFLTGKDEDGKQEMHKVTCLKELFDLKKKFKECQVFEAERIQMQ